MDFKGWWSELLTSLRGTTKPSLESVSGQVMLYWNALLFWPAVKKTGAQLYTWKRDREKIIQKVFLRRLAAFWIVNRGFLY